MPFGWFCHAVAHLSVTSNLRLCCMHMAETGFVLHRLKRSMFLMPSSRTEDEIPSTKNLLGKDPEDAVQQIIGFINKVKLV